MFRLACGMGSASWVDFGSFWRQFELPGAAPDGFVLVGAIVGTLVVILGAVLIGLVVSAGAEAWRSRPVPQLDNPLLEGATRDLALAVELLRRGVDSTRAEALLTRARTNIGRCRDRLSRRELRTLASAWTLVAHVTPRTGA